MKKLLFFLLVICFTLSLRGATTQQYSNGILSGFCITDSLISKSAAWDATNRWIATQMDSKNARVVYENVNEGTLIIKGRYKDADNRLYSVQYDFITPYVNYELEINVSDGSYCAKYNKINYEIIIGYGNTPYGLNIILNRIINEIDEIKKIMSHKGEIWALDNDFFKAGDDLNSQITEAKNRMDDKSISKKERKQYKKFYEANAGRDGIYHHTKMAAHRLVFDTLLSDGNLESIIWATTPKTTN